MLYNVKIIISKDFNYHAFSGEEQTSIKRNEKVIFTKLWFYGGLFFVMLWKFMTAMSSMMIYRIFS